MSEEILDNKTNQWIETCYSDDFASKKFLLRKLIQEWEGTKNNDRDFYTDHSSIVLMAHRF